MFIGLLGFIIRPERGAECMCHLVGEARLALLSLHPSPMVRMLRDTEPAGPGMR